MGLKAQVGELRRAAIDAWMREQGYEVRGSEYHKTDGIFGTNVLTVTVPNAAGHGGGDFDSWDIRVRDETAQFKAAFADIGAAINDTFAPWYEAPEVEGIDALVDICGAQSDALALEPSLVRGVIAGSGDLSQKLSKIAELASHMSGASITAFEESFTERLPNALAGCHAVSLARGAAVASEASLWRNARRNIGRIAAEATAVFRGIAAQTPHDETVALTVAGLAAEGLALFGRNPAAEFAAYLIHASSTLAGSSTDVDLLSGSFDLGMSSLRTAVRRLNSAITAEEDEIARVLTQNVASIESNSATFDLTPTGIRDVDGWTISMASDEVDRITGVLMPEMADTLRTVSTEIWATSPANVLARPAQLGSGSSGPTREFGELGQVLYSLLRDLAWEVTSGAKNLELAARDFFDQEADMARSLNEAARALETENPYA